jgi:hypothetical protein
MASFALFFLLVHGPVSIRVYTCAVTLTASKSLDLSQYDVALLKNPRTPPPPPPPPCDVAIHHRIDSSCFTLDENFILLWHSFTLEPSAAHVRSSFVCPEGIYCTEKYFHIFPVKCSFNLVVLPPQNYFKQCLHLNRKINYLYAPTLHPSPLSIHATMNKTKEIYHTKSQ